MCHVYVPEITKTHKLHSLGLIIRRTQHIFRIAFQCGARWRRRPASYPRLKLIRDLYPFSVHVVTFTFHYQLMHLLIKTLSQFTFKTTHVKNVCDAYLKLIKKTQHVSVSPPTIIRGQFPYLMQLLRVSLPASSHSSLWRYVVCNI